MVLKQKGSRCRLLSVSSQLKSAKRLYCKTVGGIGPKLSSWVILVFNALREEFGRLQSTGVNFNALMLVCLAKDVTKEAGIESAHHGIVIVNGKHIFELITIRRVQRFLLSNKIFRRSHTGMRIVSPQKELRDEKEIDFHLLSLKRGFETATLNEYCIDNTNDTDSAINMVIRRTLGFIG